LNQSLDLTDDPMNNSCVLHKNMLDCGKYLPVVGSSSVLILDTIKFKFVFIIYFELSNTFLRASPGRKVLPRAEPGQF
jgi:poly-D-alanine transfer protein DltD